MIDIVGAGPAGAYLFYLLSESGLEVVLHEQHRVGERIVCGELVPKPSELKGLVTNDADLFEISSLIRDLEVCLCEVERMEVHVDKRHWLTFDFKGYVVDKSSFIRKLVSLGVGEGGRLSEKSRFLDLRNSPPNLKVSFSRGIESARLLIGADGYPSRVAERAGLSSGYSLSDWALCVNQRFKNVKVEDNVVKIYFSPKMAPGGFGWIIPRGESKANVGLGVRATYIKQGFNIVKSLKSFVTANEDLSDATPITLPQLKPIPVGGRVKEMSKDNVLLIGDAAGAVVPIDGAGIVPSMLSSKAAFGAVVGQESYVELVERKTGHMIDNGLLYRKFCDRLISRGSLLNLTRLLAPKSLVESILKARDTPLLSLLKLL